MKKRSKGRPSKSKDRSHLIRFGRIHDDLQALIEEFESEKDKILVKELIESLRPKNKFEC